MKTALRPAAVRAVPARPWPKRAAPARRGGGRVARPFGSRPHYLDAFALSLCACAAPRKCQRAVLGAVGVLTDGRKILLPWSCAAASRFAAWKGCLDDLVARGLPAPMLCIIDGNPGLRRAVGEVWPRAPVQRYCVHKLP
jgi:Transposase, Mutator family